MPLVKNTGEAGSYVMTVLPNSPKTVSCDTGTVDIYRYDGGVRASAASDQVSPGSSKDVLGAGPWELVRSADTVKLYVSP